MKTLKVFFICQIIFIQPLFNSYFGQGSAGDAADQELRRLIDFPTAGALKSGYFGFDLNVLHNGILISSFSFAPFNNFNIGISYGATNIIGIGSPDFYKFPGFNAKLRVFTETRKLPSFTLGFDNQGKGSYVDSLKRYEIKSPGIYFGVSKNFKFLGYFCINGLFNYSLENGDDDRNINFVFGLEKTIGPFISFIAEYDFGLNDNSKFSIGDKKGYLNFGIRWSISKNLTFGLDFKDLLLNRRFREENGVERVLYLEYFDELF